MLEYYVVEHLNVCFTIEDDVGFYVVLNVSAFLLAGLEWERRVGG